MGKYMKKSKITGDVKVVMDSNTSGVRTRAKTLAIAAADSSYIQLRNRHVEKPPLKKQQEHQKKLVKENQDSGFSKKLSSKKSSSVNTGCVKEDEAEGCFSNKEEIFGDEVSFGENYLEFESRDRSTRESTPCNLIGDSDAIATPSSTTRRASSTAANRRAGTNMQRNIPTANEMEEFFICAEQRQQRLFIEKYNFDFANELPLPGRYEWVQVNL